MLSIVVADRAFSLAVEFKESASLPQGSVGFATYSNSKPTVLSYVTVFQSMWSQAELNAEIKRLYDQLKIQDQQQKEFMDIAAHEFKNPLQPILVLTDILQRHSTDSRSQELLNVITRNAKRLQTLQEEILDVAKIERHLLVLDRQAVDLSELVDEIVKEFQTQPNEKIEINFVCSSKLDVLADGARISQVIFNLLNNASKFSQRELFVSDAKRLPMDEPWSRWKMTEKGLTERSFHACLQSLHQSLQVVPGLDYTYQRRLSKLMGAASGRKIWPPRAARNSHSHCLYFLLINDLPVESIGIIRAEVGSGPAYLCLVRQVFHSRWG
jgi:hypothetical protein